MAAHRLKFRGGAGNVSPLNLPIALYEPGLEKPSFSTKTGFGVFQDRQPTPPRRWEDVGARNASGTQGLSDILNWFVSQ